MSGVVLTTATLDPKRGHRTCKQAAASAGVPCKIIVAHDRVNQGGVKTANQAWREALKLKPDFLCYMNDDVDANQRGWLKRLIEVLQSNSKFGLAGPSGICSTLPQRRGVRNAPKGFRVVRRLSFFTVVIKRAVLDEIGLLDESFIHWGCDSDYSNRAREHGWRCVWVKDVYLDHHITPVGQRPPHVQAWRRKDGRLFHKIWRISGRRKRPWVVK